MAVKTELEKRVEKIEAEFKVLRNNVAIVFGRVSRDFKVHRERMEEKEED